MINGRLQLIVEAKRFLVYFVICLFGVRFFYLFVYGSEVIFLI